MTSADDGTAKEKPTPDPTAWGQPIEDDRKRELQGMLDAWNAPGADHGDRRSPFDGVKLTGADVGWLAEQSGRDEVGRAPNLHLEGADLLGAHLRWANLGGA
jgi:hypothetical protein